MNKPTHGGYPDHQRRHTVRVDLGESGADKSVVVAYLGAGGGGASRGSSVSAVGSVGGSGSFGSPPPLGHFNCAGQYRPAPGEWGNRETLNWCEVSLGVPAAGAGMVLAQDVEGEVHPAWVTTDGRWHSASHGAGIFGVMRWAEWPKGRQRPNPADRWMVGP